MTEVHDRKTAAAKPLPAVARAARRFSVEYLPHLGIAADKPSTSINKVAPDPGDETAKVKDFEEMAWPRSLFSFTLSTTINSITMAIPGLGLIVCGDMILKALINIGQDWHGPLSDVHSVACMMCIGLVEFALAGMLRFEMSYMR